MAQKAIKVTKENKEQLTSQFNLEEDEIDEYIGLYMVVGFGDHMIEGYLTKDELTVEYVETGDKLENGFFEVRKGV